MTAGKTHPAAPGRAATGPAPAGGDQGGHAPDGRGATARGGAGAADGRPLAACRILVVEDEYLLADQIEAVLAEAGADVVGPAGTLDAAMALIRAEDGIDAAMLDLNLRGTFAFAAADLLLAREIPLVLATGYDDTVVPARFRGVARCPKPLRRDRILAILGEAVRDGRNLA